MFKLLKKVFQLTKKKKQQKSEKQGQFCQVSLADNLEENLQIFNNIFANSSDIVFREFYFGGNEKLPGVLIYLDNAIDKKSIQEDVLAPLMFKFDLDNYSPGDIPQAAIRVIRKNAISVAQIKEENTIEKIVDAIFTGQVALLINFMDSVLLVNVQGWDKRSISEPQNERVVRGPREGFVESSGTNVSLIRRKIRDINLSVEKMQVGKRTKTQVFLVYLQDLASPEIVAEARKRIEEIEVDGIVTAGDIEQFIQDHTWSLLPQIQATERPDKAVANILEGKITIVLEGTPIVLIIPAIFPQFMQSTDDYAERFIVGSFIRALRYLALIIASTLPAFYIALVSFHPELIPYNLVIAIGEARQEVPFPPVLEALFMEIVLEILREGGLRLPSPIGSTVGIVGGIVIGQAIVQAKIVSPIMVIVVALTAISSFTIPSYSLGAGLRIIRFFMMLWAAIFGAVGLSLAFLFLLTQTVAMESFGVPYFSPLAPTRYKDLKDTFVRAPIKLIKQRPASIPQGKIEQEKGKKKGE